jgi:serine/threonine-protein kinase
MITAQGQAKIMDFGLAQVTDRTKLTASGMKLGTPAYMSPEQTEGKPADRRSDIWALGVVLYEMISGRVPFPGEAEAAVAYAIVHTEPEPLTAVRSGVPLELDRIVEKALAKEPAVRYQHVEDLLVDVHRLRSEALTSSRAKTRRAAPPQLKWRRLVLAVAPLLLVIAAVAAWLVLRSPEAPPNPLVDARFTKLTDFEGAELDAAISSDGRLVTFLSDRDGPFDAWVGHIGGGDFVNLTKGQFQNLLNENPSPTTATRR